MRGARVASDHHGLHAAPQEICEDLGAVAPDRIRGLRPIRDAGGVTEVDHRLFGQALEQRARDGEAADARIEDAERSGGGLHRKGMLMLIPLPLGSACIFKFGGKSRRCAGEGEVGGVWGGWAVGRLAGKEKTHRGPQPPHLATNTFNLPRSSSTVHSCPPDSRSSPSTCITSGRSGERTTSLAVLMSATSCIVMCVPLMTRGMASRKRGNETRRMRQTSIFPSLGSASGANR